MTDSETERDPPLNLGLDALLRPLKDGEESENSPHRALDEVQAAGDISSAETPPPPADRKKDFSALGAAGNWKEVIAVTERLLEASDDATARAWWIRAQLEDRQVPPSILAAPVETLINTVMTSDELREELGSDCQSLVLKISKALHESGDRETALHVLQQSVSLGGEIPMLLSSYAREELHHIETHPAVKPREVEEQEKKRAQLQLIVGNSSVEGVILENGNLSEALDQKLISSAQETSAHRSRFVMSTLTLLAVIGLGWIGTRYVTPWVSNANNSAEVAPVMTAHTEPSKGDLLPPIPPRNIPGSLDTVMYDLEKRPSAEAIRPPTAVNSPVSPRVDSQPISGPRREKLTVDTSGPIEDAMILERRREAKKEGVFRNSWGELEDADGNIVSGPETKNRKEAPTPSIALATGGITRYTIITPTQILAAPSFRAATMGELESGDEVDVESQTGSFLRLRSRRGRTGYILSQDATPSR